MRLVDLFVVKTPLLLLAVERLVAEERSVAPMASRLVALATAVQSEEVQVHSTRPLIAGRHGAPVLIDQTD